MNVYNIIVDEYRMKVKLGFFEWEGNMTFIVEIEFLFIRFSCMLDDNCWFIIVF